jgi:demethylmenaquinone methyltransferase/2-methoxy-6-polyprenyl-1,4-benzoquinol methylase
MTSQDIEATRLFYTRISHVYDALADAGEHRARELGIALLDAQSDERILEIGFGTGTAILPIARAAGGAGGVLGVDISEGMCQVAVQRVASAGLSDRVDLRVAAIPPIPVAAREFDAAFMAFTLELFSDEIIPAVLQEVRRVLKRGGRFVVVAMDTGNEAQKKGFAERTYQWLHRHFPHFVDCRPIDVVRWLEHAGYTITHAKTVDIWGLPVKVCLSTPNDDIGATDMRRERMF